MMRSNDKLTMRKSDNGFLITKFHRKNVNGLCHSHDRRRNLSVLDASQQGGDDDDGQTGHGDRPSTRSTTKTRVGRSGRPSNSDAAVDPSTGLINFTLWAPMSALTV